MQINYQKVGKRIRLKRKELGITQEQLAEIADVTSTHISNIETGNTKTSTDTLHLIATALNVSIDDLLHDFDDLKQENRCEIEVKKLFQDCSIDESIALLEILKASKRAIRNLNG